MDGTNGGEFLEFRVGSLIYICHVGEVRGGPSDVDRTIENTMLGGPMDKPMTVCGKTGLIRT